MLRRLTCEKAALERDLSGKTIIVTGPTSGVGKATALQLLKQGAHVVVACRNQTLGEALVEQAKPLRGSTVAMQCDVSSFASVRNFAEAVISKYKAIDGLVNNAGCMNCPHKYSADGVELQFATNYLGPWLLTSLLMPLLEAGGGRVINVSSANHNIFAGKRGHLDLDDPSFERRTYDGWAGYAQSKLAQVLHARELARRHPSVLAVAIHPGSICTNVTRYMFSYTVRKMILPLERVFVGQVSTWVGIQTGLHCLLAERSELQNGGYYSQHRSPYGAKGGWPYRSPNPEANDDELARKLWDRSVEMVARAAAC